MKCWSKKGAPKVEIQRILILTLDKKITKFIVESFSKLGWLLGLKLGPKNGAKRGPITQTLKKPFIRTGFNGRFFGEVTILNYFFAA